MVKKEIRNCGNGIYELISPVSNTKGEYINLNTNKGELIICKKDSSLPAIPSHVSVARYEKELSINSKVFGANRYLEFREKYIDEYNKMIDVVNMCCTQ